MRKLLLALFVLAAVLFDYLLFPASGSIALLRR